MTLHKVIWNYQTTQTILVLQNYLKISIAMLKQGSMDFYMLWLNHHYRDTTQHLAACQGTIILHIHMVVALT